MAYDHHLHRGFQFGVPQDKQVGLIEDGRIQRYEINYYSLGSGYLVTPMGGDTDDDEILSVKREVDCIYVKSLQIA